MNHNNCICEEGVRHLMCRVHGDPSYIKEITGSYPRIGNKIGKAIYIVDGRKTIKYVREVNTNFKGSNNEPE